MIKKISFIMFFLVFLSSFSTIYSWRRVYYKDEFGDKTGRYCFIYKSLSDDIEIRILRNKKINDKFCSFKTSETLKTIKNKNYLIKIKSDYFFNSDSKINSLKAISKNGRLYITDNDALNLISAFEHNDIVKFNILGKSYQIETKEFKELYDNFKNYESIN